MTKIEWVKNPDGTKGETWNPVVGYSDYLVSTKGEIRSLKGNKVNILKPMESRDGYLHVFLYDGSGNSDRVRIHRAVLRTFVGEPAVNQETRHLDGNPANNSLSNLKWGTRKENAADRRRHGRIPQTHESPLAKLSPDDIPRIRKLQARLSSRKVAWMFGVSHTIIQKIWRGKRWTGY